MNQVAEKAPNPLVKLHSEMEQRTSQFQAALPAHIPVERFKRVLLTAVQNNPALATADRRSFFNSAMRAAQDGLLPDGREGAMVIFKTKVKENGREFWIEAVQWMPMIAGLRKKVRNSGEIATWDAHVVYEKDQFDFELGYDARISHKPYMGGDPGKVVAAYSVATLKSGEKSCEVMPVWQIEKVRAFSKQKDGPAWTQWYGEMCRKTVARRHSKVLPMSTDLDDLMRRDDDLYDMAGASDKMQAGPAQRPQLVDFVDAPQNPVMTEDPKLQKMEGEQNKADAAATTAVNPETGEIAEPEGATDQQEIEYTTADAYSDGEKARAAGRALKATPPEWRDNPTLQKFVDAWQAGWRSADAELAKAATK